MVEFREIPEDAYAPRYMTGAHPRAVGTLGPEFVAWANAQTGLHPRRTTGLRFWQVVVAYRLLEVDEAGELVWRNVLLTMARQVGKSWLMRALILWRLQQRDRWQEEQAVLHCAHKLSAAVEVWRPAQRWALEQGWSTRVANGEQLIEHPETGGRWLVRAASDGLGVGFSLSSLIVDEAWQIARATVEAADAALTESVSAMLMLISTAGDAASDLFSTYRDMALSQLLEPTNMLILEWSAPRELTVEDPVGWRMASPHWSPIREREYLDKIAKMERLEWEQNMLNRWIDVPRKKVEDPSKPVITEEEWAACNGYKPTPGVAPSVAAIESPFEDPGCSVVLATLLTGGKVGVCAQTYPDLPSAARALQAASPGTILAGKTLLAEPVIANLGARPMMGRSSWVASTVRRLVSEGAFRHDGSDVLTEQVLAMRTVPSVDGPRMKSMGRHDAAKALCWATEQARILPPLAQVF